jgi:hypothetical protein
MINIKKEYKFLTKSEIAHYYICKRLFNDPEPIDVRKPIEVSNEPLTDEQFISRATRKHAIYEGEHLDTVVTYADVLFDKCIIDGDELDKRIADGTANQFY